ncbi:MAG: TonB-dependent receptor [Elusimicrobia bacterium]|nr:TonB-dependent receptor [Elusimicrobiota bacterium]
MRITPVLLLLCLSPLNLYSTEKTGQDVFFSISRTAAYRALPPVDARTLDAAALERQGTASLADLLEGSLPLTIRRLNGPLGLATVSMRGFQAKQTAVFLDDVRVPSDITGTVDLSLIPAAGLGKVEILPGAASSIYGGNAEGGVVQLFTRRLSPGARLAGAEASCGSYAARHGSVKAGAAGRRLEVFFGGSSDASAGFQQNSKLDKDAANGRAALDLGAAGSLTFTGFVSRLKTGLPSGTPAPVSAWDGSKERTANSLTDRQTSRRSFLSGSWSAGGRDLALRVDSSLSANDIEAYQWGALNGAKVTDRALAARLTLLGTAVLGAESAVSRLASGTYGDHALDSAGFFAQKTFSPAEGFELTPGARLDKSAGFKSRVSPKLAAVYAPDEKWKFSASGGYGFQAPTFADLYNPWAAPTPGLKPETSLNANAAVSYGSPDGWYAGLTGYYSDIKDRIALDPVTWAAANLDAGFNTGLEAEAGFKSGAVTATAGYVRNISMVKTGGASYKLLNFSPAQRFTGSVTAKAAGLDLGLSGRGVSRQYTGRGRTGLCLPEFWVFGLTMARKLGVLELWGGVANILNRRYAETADAFNGWFPQPGRTFTAGLKARFL